MNIELGSKQTVKQSITKQNTAKQRITKRLLSISMASLMFVSIPTIYANAEEPSTSYQATESIITTTSYTTTWLRVRTEPSFDGEIVDCLEPMTEVQVIATMSNGWSAIWFDGSVRFMYSDYLTTGEYGVQQENDNFEADYTSVTFEESVEPSEVFESDFDSESQYFNSEIDFSEIIEYNYVQSDNEEEDYISDYTNEDYFENIDNFCSDGYIDDYGYDEWYADSDEYVDNEGYVDTDDCIYDNGYDWYDIDGVNTYFDEVYSAEDFKQLGLIEYNGLVYTYYSEQVLPGGGLDIPNRHINSDGYVVDGEGYIVLASPDLANYPRYSMITTPFGYGKFYDHCPEGNFDVYVAW